MRRRPWTALLLLLLALAAGCDEQSRVKASATVTVSGDLRSPAGSPLAKRPVKLGSGVGTGDGALGFLTLGLACTSGICSGKVKDTSTDAAGRFHFTLKGSETQSSFGEALSELLTGSAAPRGSEVSGASVSARFRIQAEQVRLPRLALVDPRLSLSSSGRSVQASWSATRPGPYRLSFENDTTVPIWESSTAGTRLPLDGRLLEDSSGRAVVSASASDQIAGSDLTITWRSPGIGYVAGAGAPLSRGRLCTFVYPQPAPPSLRCPLTDGDLTSHVSAPRSCPAGAKQCLPPTSVVVDLGAIAPVQLIVVRGCRGGCAVDVSLDSRAFAPAGSVSDDYGSVALASRPARFVRVGLGSGDLREVSVWGPSPGLGLQSLSDATRERLSQPYSGHPQGRDWTRLILTLVAAGLVAIGLLGVGIAIGRRRT